MRFRILNLNIFGEPSSNNENKISMAERLRELSSRIADRDLDVLAFQEMYLPCEYFFGSIIIMRVISLGVSVGG